MVPHQWQGKPLLVLAERPHPAFRTQGDSQGADSPAGHQPTSRCRAHSLWLCMGHCKRCPDFLWTCLGTGWSSNTRLCGLGGLLQGPTPPQQGGPLLAIGREAPPSIQNTRKLPRAEFPTRQQLTSHRQAHGLWPCPRRGKGLPEIP